MLSLQKVKEIFELKLQDKSNSEIARLLEIDRETVRLYLRKDLKELQNKLEVNFHNLSKTQQMYYAYWLGLYLGDGFISKFPRTYRMRIYLHSSEDEIINRCIKAIYSIFPQNKIAVYKQLTSNCKEVSVYNTNLCLFFPQHGIGKKSDREIILTDWQKEILKNNSQYFLTGLFDSDGCQFKQTNTKDKIYYQFTNKSKEILNLFLDYCSYNNITGILTRKYREENNGIKNIYIRKNKDREAFKVLLENCYKSLDIPN